MRARNLSYLGVFPLNFNQPYPMPTNLANFCETCNKVEYLAILLLLTGPNYLVLVKANFSTVVRRLTEVS